MLHHRIALVLAILVAAVLAPAAGAHAATWPDEQAMVNSSHSRDTFVADPTQGHRWNRADLIAAHGAYYRTRGFANVLTWVPQTSQIRPSGATRWAGCGSNGVQIPGDCPGGRTLHLGEIGDALADTTITVLAYDGAFIAMACGNFSERQTDGPPPPTISGTKFEDVDGDGARDAGEPRLAGWTIRLYQDGRHLASTVTDANGAYRFVLDADSLDIRSEHYELREDQQAGWAASRTPEPFTVSFGSAGAVIGDKDFGNYRPATIEGVKFDDHDVDRARDAGEPGLAGWEIGLSAGRSPAASDVTGDDGRYGFTGLIPGTYTVGETQQDGWRQSAPAGGTHQVTVRSGETATADFGNVCLGTAQVTIENETTGAPIGGVEVRIEEIAVPGVLSNEPALPRTTSGTPTFGDLLPGAYRIVVFLPARVYTTDPDLTVVDGRLAIVKQITVNECQTTVVPITLFPTSMGKVTGGMKMAVPGGFATAGYVFMTRSGMPQGSLEYIDHVTGLNLHSEAIEQIHVRDNEAWIGGLVDIGGASYRFSLHLVDNGEPGTNDRFELLVENGYRAGYDQTIEGGNDQIHRPERT